mgnify:FL=1
MIKRRLDRQIEEHYKTSSASLLLTGARQTGKTFAVRKFARDSGLELVEINFYEDSQAITIFEGAKDADDVLFRLSAYTNTVLKPGNTLIFFDEIQKFPDIVTWIKFLVEEGSYKYALSGSLLWVELKNIRSVPVGYMSVIDVYPLDMEEFFRAVGVSDAVLDSVELAFSEKRPVDRVVHDSLMRLVGIYLVVGGMPAAVQAYIDTNNLQNVNARQADIMRLYKWDISQYDPGQKLGINEMFDLIPSELNACNKRFVLKRLNEHARFQKYENGFIWLKDAGAALPVYNVSEPVSPLKLNEERNLFKLFQNDVGLLSSQYSDGIALRIIRGEVNVNYGAVYENLTAQELSAHGFSLYYFNSKKLGELDFVLETSDGVVPVEVKSGKDYERHNALKNVLACDNYGIRNAIVLTNDNLRTSGRVTYMPIYMLMFIRKNAASSPQIVVPDLTGLV